MTDLTDADLEAMEKRCEAVRTEAVRENSPWNPWFMGQAEILATDIPALIAALREARGKRDVMSELYAREGHKSLVLLNENTSLLAENRLLVACLNSIRCLAVEGIGAEWEELAPKVVSIYATCTGPELVPLTAAEAERVKRLEKAEQLLRRWQECGGVADNRLREETRAAIAALEIDKTLIKPEESEFNSEVEGFRIKSLTHYINSKEKR